MEFEPVFIHTYKDVQGIESNIQYAHSHSDAFIIANKMEKDWTSIGNWGMFIPAIILLIPLLIAHIGTVRIILRFRNSVEKSGNGHHCW